MINNLNTRDQQFLASLNRIQSRIDRATSQVSSGLRITNASDAPDEIGALLQSRAELAVAEQSRSNLSRVRGEVDSAENALRSVIELAERARVLGAQGQTGTQTAVTRTTIAAELEGIFRQIVGAANTNFEGRFLFSGNNDQVQPYTVDFSQTNGVTAYGGTTATRSVPDANGVMIPIGRSGQEIFDSPVPGASLFGAISSLRTALLANDEAALELANENLGSALNHVNTQLTRYGHTQNDIGSAIEIATKRTLDLKMKISTMENADLADAILELQTGQTARQAALQAKGQEDRRTLFDFLR
jgi:flagellar hook-associated protein 3 FlgL